MDCKHDLNEQETAVWDGLCPLCLRAELYRYRKALEIVQVERDHCRKALEIIRDWSLPTFDPENLQTEGEEIVLWVTEELAAIFPGEEE